MNGREQVGVALVDETEWWKQLGTFWDRATGGPDVASRPTDDQQFTGWPTVPRAAGLDAATGWMAKGMTSGADVPRFLFLVGGPGAGKSHAAAELVKDLRQLDEPSELAKRTYSFATSDRNLVVVNDATIQSDDFPTMPLANEVDAVIDSQAHLLACVNRGVLVEEIAQLREAGSSIGSSSGSAIIHWLSGKTESSANRTDWTVETTDQGNPCIWSGRLFEGESEEAEILVVFVDVVSLFELSPQVAVSGDVMAEIRADAYQVTKFQDRRTRSSTFCPAGELFDKAIAGLPSSPVGRQKEFADPFRANLQSLQSDDVRKGLLSVLRASEIVAGQRMTFREVWGAVSRSVIGGAHMVIPPDRIRQLVSGLQPTSTDSARVRFEKLRELAEYRFTQGIFGAGHEATDVLRDPVLAFTNLVDPVRDAAPGWFLANRDSSGWASPIADAFSGDSGSASPLQAMRESTATHGSAKCLSAVVTEFDELLDAAYVAALTDPESLYKETERQEATSWYGAYVTRLFAVANGLPAYLREVAVWTLAWTMAPNIPHALEPQMKTLLKPVRHPEKGTGVPLFPIFDSRTTPIQGDQIRPRIAVRSDDVLTQSSTRGDSLFVTVKEAGRPDVSMVLDFAMIRETMACASGFSGATELSEATSPRLERFRAARLVPGKGMGTSNYRVVVGSEDYPLTVGGAQ